MCIILVALVSAIKAFFNLAVVVQGSLHCIIIQIVMFRVVFARRTSLDLRVALRSFRPTFNSLRFCTSMSASHRTLGPMCALCLSSTARSARLLMRTQLFIALEYFRYQLTWIGNSYSRSTASEQCSGNDSLDLYITQYRSIYISAIADGSSDISKTDKTKCSHRSGFAPFTSTQAHVAHQQL